MKIEIIAASLADVCSLNKIKGPIEIELCGYMEHDGLTPDIDEIIRCVNTSKHPIRVMIRTHNNGFSASNEDVDLMIGDLKTILSNCSPTGFVYGFLNETQDAIDTSTMYKFLEHTKNFDNTFHKAIDRIIDVQTVDQLRNLGISRILTQGGTSAIGNNIDVLKKMYETKIIVVAGGGVTLDNYQDLIPVCDILHFGRAVRINNSYEYDYDKDVIEKIMDDISVI